MTLLLASATDCNRLQPSATVRNRLQPSSTVRLRPSWPQSCRAYGRSRTNVSFSTIFDVSPDVLMSFCVAGVALCDIPACFTTHQKSFCVAGAILLLHVHTMRSIFRGRRSTLDTSDVILRGRRSTLDVSFCVFYANCIVSAARSGDKVQIPSKT